MVKSNGRLIDSLTVVPLIVLAVIPDPSSVSFLCAVCGISTGDLIYVGEHNGHWLAGGLHLDCHNVDLMWTVQI